MSNRPPLWLFSIEQAMRLNARLLFSGRFFSRLIPSFSSDLSAAHLTIDSARYLTASFFSCTAYFIIVFILFSILQIVSGLFNPLLGLVSSIIISSVFFGVMIIYPKIRSAQLAVEVNEYLSMALRSILVQVSAGNNLYQSIVNVAKGNYGSVSDEFDRLIQSISSGESEIIALEKLALNTKSEYLQKALWQLITSIRSGSSLSLALNNVIENLINHQMVEIKNYASELNFWLLIYLLFAAALPTLGVTFLVIFSSLGGLTIQPLHVLIMVGLAFVVQIILLGLLRSRIPRVYV